MYLVLRGPHLGGCVGVVEVLLDIWGAYNWVHPFLGFQSLILSSEAKRPVVLYSVEAC